jgi:hypothetical protein
MIYKCRPYYTECLARGKEITSEEHLTWGKRLYNYYECLSEGINPISNKPCRHCLVDKGNGKNHWLIPRRNRNRDGECRIVKVGREKGRADYV